MAFKFKVPSLMYRKQPNITTGLGKSIPEFQWDALTEQHVIGSGAFGQIIKARHLGKEIVIKKLLSENVQDKRTFFKEARLLESLENELIVKFHGICLEPCSIILEYVVFDFGHFGYDKKVNSLEEYLHFTDSNEWTSEMPFQFKIGNDIAKGIKYLHDNGVTHRDLKPANVLVSNQHYGILQGEAMTSVFETCPIICKLTDFGESRSVHIQTGTLCSTITHDIGRGTLMYMAPEIISTWDPTLKCADLSQLMQIDIWAFGMVLFMIVNPDLKMPYQQVIDDAKANGVMNLRQLATNTVLDGKLPAHSERYYSQQADEWLPLVDLFNKCVRFEANERLSAADVVAILERKPGDTREDNCLNIPLGVSQATALEMVDMNFVKNGHILDTSMPINDGTNACAILCVCIADNILRDFSGIVKPGMLASDWKKVAALAENAIVMYPATFNSFRNINTLYDVLEGYDIASRADLLSHPYEFYEDIPLQDCVYSTEGKQALVKSLTQLDTTSLALFTCGGYIFIVGKLVGTLFILDTHPLSADLGGQNGNGLLKVFAGQHSVDACLSWMHRRLQVSGVKSQSNPSLLRMQLPPASRYACTTTSIVTNSDESFSSSRKRPRNFIARQTTDDRRKMACIQENNPILRIPDDVPRQENLMPGQDNVAHGHIPRSSSTSSSPILRIPDDVLRHENLMPGQDNVAHGHIPRSSSTSSSPILRIPDDVPRHENLMPGQDNVAHGHIPRSSSTSSSPILRIPDDVLSHENLMPGQDNVAHGHIPRSSSTSSSPILRIPDDVPRHENLMPGQDNVAHGHIPRSSSTSSSPILRIPDDVPRHENLMPGQDNVAHGHIPRSSSTSSSPILRIPDDVPRHENLMPGQDNVAHGHIPRSSSTSSNSILTILDDVPRHENLMPGQDDVARGHIPRSTSTLPVQLYWKQDKRLPIFHKGRNLRYTAKEATEILLINARTTEKCNVVPLRPRENVSFMINMKNFQQWEDVKSDMNGVYDRVLRCVVWTVRCDVGIDELDSFEIMERRQAQLNNSSEYHLRINSRSNKACPSLGRTIFMLVNNNGETVNNACVIQYHIFTCDDSVNFEVASHGNSSTNAKKAFFPTSKSVRDAIKENLKDKSVTDVYRSVSDATGGPLNAYSPEEIPRSKKQVHNFVGRIRLQEDPVNDLLVYAHHKDENVVLHHADVPTDIWILGSETMCSDIAKFSASSKLSYPLSVDPTFNMGQFEVTPVVYKHLFLTSKRMGTSPVFLGLTMIHHKKDFQSYKVLSATCVSNCKGLEKAKAFITDGEQELIKAFKSDLPKATALRCFKHFEGNVKRKLELVGIRQDNDKRVFLREVFGVKGKKEGILDAKDGEDLVQRVENCKSTFNDAERRLLDKKEEYTPQFWLYLHSKLHTMRKCMIISARLKAGLPLGEDGKPLRSYTNMSECMNNIMASEKKNFLGKDDRNLTKLEFTVQVFESILKKQQHELSLAVAGISEKYELAECAKYLAVPIDTWFDWSSDERKFYIKKFNSLAISDVLEKKGIVMKIQSEFTEESTEFIDFSEDVRTVLMEIMTYKPETANLVVDSALQLVNMPHAIERQATFHEETRFDVASCAAKQGRVQCVVNKNFVSCKCASFKYDMVCKHSLAVAEKVGILNQHLRHITKTKLAKKRSTLAESNVNKDFAGKKGSRNKNKYRPPPVRGQNHVLNTDAAATKYTELHHNDNPFMLRLLPENAKKCKSCNTDFCHRRKIIPFDMVFEHMERYFFPLNKDWSQKQASNKEAKRYYHISNQCIKQRFPYFSNEYIEISADMKVDLLAHPSRLKVLDEEFGFTMS